MWSSIVAVVGTLAGAALATAFQHLADRRARAEQYRQRITTVIAELLTASIAYRRETLRRFSLLRQGLDLTDADDDALHTARSTLTNALDRVALTVDDHHLVALAYPVVWEAIEMSETALGMPANGRFADDVEAALTARREAVRDAHTALRNAAREHVFGR
ncbi:MAG TPA: hypothetical protein VIU15_38370 [Streptomyces sp.]